MNIENLSDEQKSVMLARLRGWIRPAGDGYKPGLWIIEVPAHPGWEHMFWKSEPFDLPGFDLYNPANMALACNVLNSAHPLVINYDEFSTCAINLVVYGQRGAIDYVLLRAIEEGMIEVSE